MGVCWRLCGRQKTQNGQQVLARCRLLRGAGRKSNKCDSFNFSVVVSIKVAPDGVEGGGGENSHSCKKEVMELRCGSAKFGFG